MWKDATTATATVKRTWKKKKVEKAKQHLCTCITLFGTFLCRHCTNTTWKFLISCFKEDVKTRQRNFVSLSELGIIRRKWSLQQIACVRQSKRVEIIAIEIERTCTHSLSDVFATVAFVVALGTLSNGDSDGNENVKKKNRLNRQNNNSARASLFLVHFFTVTFCGGRELKTTAFFFFSWTSIQSF